ncbi:hypothetical protein B0H11DRAFT_793514 [Mycena galericulata]|nr:hypothetical protein B0H11DRAFT_793514 [Mycena galericulata]
MTSEVRLKERGPYSISMVAACQTAIWTFPSKSLPVGREGYTDFGQKSPGAKHRGCPRPVETGFMSDRALRCRSARLTADLRPRAGLPRVSAEFVFCLRWCRRGVLDSTRRDRQRLSKIDRAGVKRDQGQWAEEGCGRAGQKEEGGPWSAGELGLQMVVADMQEKERRVPLNGLTPTMGRWLTWKQMEKGEKG